jgi:hypothetical protein
MLLKNRVVIKESKIERIKAYIFCGSNLKSKKQTIIITKTQCKILLSTMKLGSLTTKKNY